MPVCEFKDLGTDEIRQGLNFDQLYGQEPVEEIIYFVSGVLIQAPDGGEDISYADGVATLNPLGLTCELGESVWEIIDYNYHGDGTWDVNVKNIFSEEVKTGALAFDKEGVGYEIECGGNEFVMASCGGYLIEDTWDGQTCDEWKRLKGTGEIISASCDGVTAHEYWDNCQCNACYSGDGYDVNIWQTSYPYAPEPGDIYWQAVLFMSYIPIGTVYTFDVSDGEIITTGYVHPIYNESYPDEEDHSFLSWVFRNGEHNKTGAELYWTATNPDGCFYSGTITV